MLIHQIFFKFDKVDIDDIPIYKKSIEAWKKLAKQNNYTYKLYNETDCDAILLKYPKYLDFYKNEFNRPIVKHEICRYLILYLHGGVYIDLDILPTSKDLEWIEAPCFRIDSGRKRGTHYSNDFIALDKGDERFGLEMIDYCVQQYREKSKKYLELGWAGRLVLQSTGAYCISRYIKKNEISINSFQAICYSSKGIELCKIQDSKIFVNHTSLW